jgi:hypothetical protein
MLGLIALVVLVPLCGVGALFVSCRTTRPDTSPPFSLGETEAFRLEFGRGSGWHGLDTVKVDSGGETVLHRLKREQWGNSYRQVWETTRLKLSSADVKELVRKVNSIGLLKMNKAYHDENLVDGTQWVFWVRQGSNEKSIYFNNFFPHEITEFAQYLDELLGNCGLTTAQWQLVPDSEARQHEKEIWSSIR